MVEDQVAIVKLGRGPILFVVAPASYRVCDFALYDLDLDHFKFKSSGA